MNIYPFTSINSIPCYWFSSCGLSVCLVRSLSPMISMYHLSCLLFVCLLKLLLVEGFLRVSHSRILFSTVLAPLFHWHFRLPCVHLLFLSSSLSFLPFWLNACSSPKAISSCSSSFLMTPWKCVLKCFYVECLVCFLLNHENIMQNERNGTVWHRCLVFAVGLLFIHSQKEVTNQS